jgi:type II secretory pathway pseudopilin PulG
LRRTKSAFTLIEVLVIVAIIAVVVAILSPVLVQAKELTRRVICGSQNHQIHMAFKGYLEDNDGCPPVPPRWAGGCGYWEYPLGRPLGPDADYAYWGVAYGPYLDGTREVFLCPSAKGMMNCAGLIWGDWDNQPWCTYGLNRSAVTFYNIGKGIATGIRKPFAVKNPTQTVFCQDAYEHLLEGRNPDYGPVTDGLSAWGKAINLTQWRPPCNSPVCAYAKEGHSGAYFRHLDACVVLWYDGRVTWIAETDGREIPKEWYTCE